MTYRNRIDTDNPPVCAGVHGDCGEDAVFSIERPNGTHIAYLCEDCADEYRNMLLATSWNIPAVGAQNESVAGTV